MPVWIRQHLQGLHYYSDASTNQKKLCSGGFHINDMDDINTICSHNRVTRQIRILVFGYLLPIQKEISTLESAYSLDFKSVDTNFLYTISNNIEVYEVPVKRTKKKLYTKVCTVTRTINVTVFYTV